MSEADIGDRHRLRAHDALANHICTSRLTDGFCVARHDPDCKCHREADSLLDAMASVGVVPLWLFDRTLAGETK
ncbi:hypothetical protein M1D80_11770 [Phyllobacteriaceae bacterium JZ32]